VLIDGGWMKKIWTKDTEPLRAQSFQLFSFEAKHNSSSRPQLNSSKQGQRIE